MRNGVDQSSRIPQRIPITIRQVSRRISMAWVRYAAGLWALLFVGLSASLTSAQDVESILLTVRLGDDRNPEAQWPHLSSFHRHALDIVYESLSAEIRPLKRIVINSRNHSTARVPPWRKTRVRSGETFALYLTLRRFGKLFRNRSLYHTRQDLAATAQEPMSYEMMSLPVLSGALEARLVNLKNEKTTWSALHDSSVLLPHHENFIYNPEKYPGLMPQDIIRDYAVPILRMRSLRPSALRMLAVADRWYISDEAEDRTAAVEMLKGMVADLVPEIDAHLPLYGSVDSLAGRDKKDRPLVRINLGYKDGIHKKARLDVLRPEMPDPKIGQVEVLSVDSTSAIGYLRKLERTVRKRGDTVHIGDQIVSRKRPPTQAKRNRP